MNETGTYIITVFMSFFAIMNPIANAPIFLGLMQGESTEDKRKVAGAAAVTAFIIVLSFAIAGKYIFELFGLTIPAFKITGGIIIFYVGFEMLMSQKSKIHNTDSRHDPMNIAISPLAIPILAGPGTIVTTMNHVIHAGLIRVGIVIGIFFLVTVLNYLAFLFGDTLMKKLGTHLISVISKLMGLILAIIGTEMTTGGLKIIFG